MKNQMKIMVHAHFIRFEFSHRKRHVHMVIIVPQQVQVKVQLTLVRPIKSYRNRRAQPIQFD